MNLILEEATDASRTTLAAALRDDKESHWLTSWYQDSTLWAEKDKTGEHVTYVALDEDGKAVGFVTLSYMDYRTQAHLEYYITPEHRGNGYSVKLLNEMKKAVKKDNPRSVTLIAGIKEDNAPSLRAIEKANFLYQWVNYGNHLYTYIVH